MPHSNRLVVLETPRDPKVPLPVGYAAKSGNRGDKSSGPQKAKPPCAAGGVNVAEF